MVSPEQMYGETRGAEEMLRSYTGNLVVGMRFAEGGVSPDQVTYANKALKQLDSMRSGETSLGADGEVAVRGFLETIAAGKRPSADDADKVSVLIRG